MLRFLSQIYGAGARLRAESYRRGWRRVHRLGVPVVSVGNLTTGGTGKTPVTAWAAQVLAESGRRVCILTRGYGRVSPRERVLVSNGVQVLTDARTGGDEPLWLAEKLRGVAAVVADADRVNAALWAMKELDSDCFLLDDGFQHLRLARDCDLVILDATAPRWQLQMLPQGRLREPLTALRRASACLVTRADQAQDVDNFVAQVRARSRGRPTFCAVTRLDGVRSLTPDAPALSSGARVYAFCGLGRPDAFFTQTRQAGYILAGQRAFRDHHRYTPNDARQITQAAREADAVALLTTAKDAVKLRELQFDLPLYVLDITIAFDRDTELQQLLLSSIHR